MRYDPEQFGTWVQEAWDSFPPDIKRRVADVSILILDNPTPEQIDDLGMLPDEELPFGIYAGGSFLDKEAGASPLEPPRIALFPQAFYACCDSESEIRQEIRITLWHEIAHRLGFDEENMPTELL